MENLHLGLFMMLCFGAETSSSQILQRHKRNWIIDSFQINEGYTGPFPYLLDRVNIERNFTFFSIEGQGVDEEPTGILTMNQYTGELFVHGPVDHEKFRHLKVKFQAMDKFSRVIDTRLGIEIQIIDENDNAPEFEQRVYEATIDESTKQGSDVITIKAIDKDSSEQNHKFTFRIVSVNPKPQDLDFYLTQTMDVGMISFKGCLDHEKAEKYSIIVEAKDHGQHKQLSSSSTVIINIKDGNNHLPFITKQTGPGTIKEGQENVVIACLQVADEDTRGTKAWKAKLQILGDSSDDFKIIVNSTTNEGCLYAQKQLNYEAGALRNVMISVENEIPYFSCKVERRTASGLWIVSGTSGTQSGTVGTSIGHWSTFKTTVTVEDVNEPPIFDEQNKTVQVHENGNSGQILCQFTTKDPDIASANTVVYIKGDDPAGWVTVDRSSGNVTLSKTVDRESPYVKDNVYVVTVCAVDNGKPPMTSTATLSIKIIDENDNAPTLYRSTIDICQSNGTFLANITALDLDENPYGGPFNFKLLGDFKGKWKIDPAQGYSVNLVKGNTVNSGNYMFSLEVSDLQGKTAIHNLTVTVCTCVNTARPNCQLRKSSGTAPGHAAIGLILLSMLIFAGVLLLAFLMSCKTEMIKLPDEGSEPHLMLYNTEDLGTDCQVDSDIIIQGHGQMAEQQYPSQIMMPSTSVSVVSAINGSKYGMAQREIRKPRCLVKQWDACSATDVSFMRRDPARWSMNSAITNRSRMRFHRGTSLCESSMRNSKLSNMSKYESWSAAANQELLVRMNMALCVLQAKGAELGDFAPHVYAEEGDPENSFELDSISIPDTFNLDFCENLDFSFKTLASICMPTQSYESTETNSFSQTTSTSSMTVIESHKAHKIQSQILLHS